MPIFDTLIPAAFRGIKFPLRSVTVRGGLRDHVHEFPHANGGLPEKLGRKLYDIRMTASFHVTFRRYPDLWPKGINDLFAAFESGETHDLAIPTLGTIRAYAVDWSKVSDARARSGEEAEFSFREDSAQATLQGNLHVGSIDKLAAEYERFAKPAEASRAQAGDLLDSLQGAVNAVTSVKDQLELQSNLVAARLNKVAGLCRDLDETVKYFDEPVNHAVKDALHDLWFAALTLAVDVSRRVASPRIYLVPTLMPVTTIAASALGDGSRAVEIMQLNALEDPFAVRPGTEILLPAEKRAA
jgi:prophage DNA circulation protein